MSPEALNQALLWSLRIAYPILALIALKRRFWNLPLWTLYLCAVSVSAWLYVVPWTIGRVVAPDLGAVLPLRVLATAELTWKLLEWEPERHAAALKRLLLTIAAIGVACVWPMYADGNFWQWYKLIRICLHVGLAFGFCMLIVYLWIYGQRNARYVRAYSAIWLLHLGCYATTGLSTSSEWWDAVESGFLLGSLLCIGLWFQQTLKPLDTRL